LKNHGVEEEANMMFDMGAETMNLPLSTKMEFEQGDDGVSFGYKAKGANAVDDTGAKDTVEFINVSRDDTLAYPKVVHRTYPSTVNARMESTIVPFVKKSSQVNDLMMEVLGDRLGFPKGTLSEKHRWEEKSGSETRCIKKLPTTEIMTEAKSAIGAHTDFGSMSFLHNRLGGLQVLVPGTDEWQYIKPIPGCAICNLGDAMAIFSGGILRSNLHRVVPPPGEQGKYERWSLVFFTRPGASQILEPIKESKMVTESASNPENARFNTGGTTSGEWFARRIKNQRVNNRTGPETWRASRGTEHKPEAY